MLQRYLDHLPNSLYDPLTLQQVAYDFRQEVRSREAFEEYCQWYYAQAEQNKAELAAMEYDIPLFAWFNRGRP